MEISVAWSCTVSVPGTARRRANFATPRDRSCPTETASNSYDVWRRSSASVQSRLYIRPWMTRGSPSCTDSNTFSPSFRQHATLMRRLSPSTQRLVARSYRRDVDAKRNVTTYVPVCDVRRHSGAVITLPISVTAVSNMASPCIETSEAWAAQLRRLPESLARSRRACDRRNAQLWTARAAVDKPVGRQRHAGAGRPSATDDRADGPPTARRSRPNGGRRSR